MAMLQQHGLGGNALQCILDPESPTTCTARGRSTEYTLCAQQLRKVPNRKQNRSSSPEIPHGET
eukprot:4224781-Alexandrium_andersonii.AAC.1